MLEAIFDRWNSRTGLGRYNSVSYGNALTACNRSAYGWWINKVRFGRLVCQSADLTTQEYFMLHQYLWTIALALIPAGILVRLFGSREQGPRPVPIESRRSPRSATEN